MIHIELLVEDSSGQAALDGLLPGILPIEVTFRIRSYKGVGRLPKNLNATSDPAKRILLDQLPRLLSGYGKTFRNDPASYTRVVFIICDLDKRDRASFENEILAVVDQCVPKPRTTLCLSIEEGEAWLLGDAEAIMQAFPRTNRNDLMQYEPDAICGTWEVMADLLEKGGARALKKLGHREIGRAKHNWARTIAPLIDVKRNRSPSFQEFIAKVFQIVN